MSETAIEYDGRRHIADHGPEEPTKTLCGRHDFVTDPLQADCVSCLAENQSRWLREQDGGFIQVTHDEGSAQYASEMTGYTIEEIRGFFDLAASRNQFCFVKIKDDHVAIQG